MVLTEYAEYAEYAEYTEYAEYADYAEYAEYIEYAEYGEDPPFGSEARDAFGLRTNGAGGVASSRFTKKSSEIDL